MMFNNATQALETATRLANAGESMEALRLYGKAVRLATRAELPAMLEQRNAYAVSQGAAKWTRGRIPQVAQPSW